MPLSANKFGVLFNDDQSTQICKHLKFTNVSKTDCKWNAMQRVNNTPRQFSINW